MAKQSGGAFGTVSMIVAFVVMGLFLVWLGMVSEPREVAIADEEEVVQPMVTLTDFAMNPMAYSVTPVDLDGIEVQENVGAQAFLFALPDGSPYLVRLPVTAGASGIEVVPGDVVRVTGHVEPMSESVIQAWDSLGVFTDPDHRMTAESVATFLAAETVQVTTPAGAAVLENAAPEPPGQE